MSAGPCTVCTSEDGRLHYGARCCSRCKVFFRKAVRTKVEYTCTKRGNCVIEEADRKCCQACRFRRCFAAGLDPKLVHSDRKWDKDAPTAKKKRSPPSSNPPTSNETETTASDREDEERSCSTSSSSALACINREVNVPFDGPLGWRSALKTPARHDLEGLLEYFQNVDRFVDEYCDTHYSHIHPTAPFYKHDMNLSVEEAFHAPRRLSSRSKILWSADTWITRDSLTSVWCRQIQHFIDWTSHIPELRQLEAEDRLRMLATQGFAVHGLTVFHRTLKHTKKHCLLTSGGTYLPLCRKEIDAAEVVDDFLLEAAKENGPLFGLVLDPLKTLKLSDEEEPRQ
ncbi:Ligand-binding domain of nuclear hormone receptor [Aphelenchoides fujianensis]|nr:Ligand-binding domain of nuclear hormone receptor [Aphelenchoides fujianensis]